MPIDKQVISIPLTQGVDTKSDSKQIKPGEQSAVENMLFTKPGKFVPRNGYQDLSTATYTEIAGSITAGSGIDAYTDTLVLNSKDGVYSYLKEKQQWVMATGGMRGASNTVRNVLSAAETSDAYDPHAGSNIQLDFAQADNGMQAWVYLDSARAAYISFYSPDTNTLTAPIKNASGGGSTIESIKVVAIGNTFHVLQLRHASGTNYSIVRAVFTGSATAIWAFTAVIANFSGLAPTIGYNPSIPLDCYAVGSILYTVSFNKLLYRTDTVSLATTSVALGGAAATTASSVTVDASTGNVIAAWAELTTANQAKIAAASFTGTLTPVSTKTSATNYFIATDTYRTIGVAAGLTGALIIAGHGAPGASKPMAWLSPIDATADWANLPMAASAGTLNSKPAYLDGVFYFSVTGPNPVQLDTDPQKQIFVAAFVLTGIKNPSIIQTGACTSIGNYGYGEIELNTCLSNTLISGNTVGIPYNTSSQSGVLQTQSVPIYTFKLATLTPGAKSQAFSYGKALNYINALPSAYDEAAVYEMGFATFPVIDVTSSTGAGTIAPGTYSYQVMYTYTDSRGQVIRSAPSLPTQITLASPNNTVTIGLSAPFFSNKTSYTVEVYRTLAAGTVYYLDAVLIVDPLSPEWTTASPAAIVDTSPDAAIMGGQQIYTQGGEVENIKPPAAVSGWSFKNRAFIVPAESTSEIWYSKEIVQGVPLEFNDAFILPVDERGGGVTAGAQMDDKNIIFKRDLVFYSAGNGPSPNGLNNDFLAPQLLASDTGCSERDSVVLTPAGLMFKSPKGIYMLSRGLELGYIGAPVEEYNDLTITSAQLFETKNQVRFTTSGGIELLYDYYAKQWDIITPIAAVDACSLGGLYYHLTADGVVHQETPNAYLDNSAPITTVIETGWLSFAQVQGFERLRQLLILGTSLSANTITVSFAYDFIESFTQATPIVVSGAVDPFERRVFFNRQKCTAVKIRLSCLPTAAPWGGMEISNLAMEVGMKQGTNKIRASRSYGK